MDSGDSFPPLEDRLKDALSQRIAKSIAMQVGGKFSDYSRARRSNTLKVDSHRKGPIPIEECSLSNVTQSGTYGTLDSECEELDFEDVREKNCNRSMYNKIRVTTNERGHCIASCRSMIMYFVNLAKSTDEEEVIDLNFVDHLLESGADVNFPDKHGQTIMHEISRGWHPDVAKFALEHGTEINKADFFGRTPLHLAAAVDYGDMVEYLVENGADINAETHDEKQTAMHYAAKNNGCQSVKVLLRLGARINARDYKDRTPLFVAAETARAESAQFLIEQGAPCGVYDSSGTSLLSLLIENMPHIADEAASQFHLVDMAFRKNYYYLSYLEEDPKFLLEKIPDGKRERREFEAKQKAEKKESVIQGCPRRIPKTFAKTPLKVIVEHDKFDIIMFPVFQRLIAVKWNLFGRKGVWKMVALNLAYTLIWTVLGILIPRDGEHFYTPIKENCWRIILEIILVILTVYFLLSEVSLLKSDQKANTSWKHWRTKHLERDLQFCHPRWPEEEKYLRSELIQIRSHRRTYFGDPWNVFEWASYLVVLALVLTRALSVGTGNETARNLHPRFYAIGLIVLWLRFMRCCRPFRMIGPFIAILGSVIADTLRFAFLFFEFFIPYTVAFWILFGGSSNAIKMGDDAVDWTKFHDLTFNVWWMTFISDKGWDGIIIIDRLMAQILCGSYFALSSVVCMNLYIALLSDTFTREYAQAQANAVMQQAKAIIVLESKLSKRYRSKYGHYMQDHCSPEEVYARDDDTSQVENHEIPEQLDRMIRKVNNRIDDLDDSMKVREPRGSSSIATPEEEDEVPSEAGLPVDFIQKQVLRNEEEKMEIEELKNIVRDIKAMLCQQQMR